MPPHRRRSLLALIVVLALAAAGSGMAATAPKSGARYAGETEKGGDVMLRISAKEVQIFAFDFACGRKAGASTSLQSIPIQRSDAGYRFRTAAKGIVSYDDDQPDENGTITIRGRFSPSAKTVSGWLRVKTARCHDSGALDWRAKR